MTKLQTIYHKKNELFEVEFYKDKECTEDFDFTNAKNLYIQPVNGDCTPIFALSNKLSGLGIKARIFTPIWHLGWRDGISPATPIVTLNDVLDGEDSSNVNLSKYIPEDNAVLFLSEEDCDKYCECVDTYFVYPQGLLPRVANSEMDIRDWKKIAIFLQHGTQSELEKANEVARELKEKYEVEKVNLFALHCFLELKCDENIIDELPYYTYNYFNGSIDIDVDCIENLSINKIITTNSTGILKPQNTERLQVVDSKEIFEEYLKTPETWEEIANLI